MKGHEGVWFATGRAIADWWLKQNFSEKSAPLRIAAASSHSDISDWLLESLGQILPKVMLDYC
jgi:hypothetical protein